jgi:hypothetical protein
MVDIIGKAKEKAKDIKNTVVDNTKDVVDAAKESFSAPTISSSSSSSSSITPNPTFTSSSSVTYVPNSEKNNSDIEIEKVDSPLTEYTGSEQKIFSTNIKENDSIKNTNYDSAVIRNLQIDKQDQYDEKQNNEFFNPFILNMKLWQNYYITWMNFYTGLLESFNRTIRNI